MAEIQALRKISVIFVTILIGFAPISAFASNQKLLNDLAESPTVQAAQPIIDALWQGWIYAHQSEHELALMTSGIEAMGQRRLHDAENIFDELIQKSPAFLEAWNKRATVRFMQGKLEASRDDVFEVLRLEPRHFGALSGLGLIYLRLGQLENALEAYKKLQSVFPASPEVARYMPLLRKRLGLTDL